MNILLVREVLSLLLTLGVTLGALVGVISSLKKGQKRLLLKAPINKGT